MGDICKPADIEHAFANVDCVFHCAAYINFQYPPNFDELERVNVMGNLLYSKLTGFAISLCAVYCGFEWVNEGVAHWNACRYHWQSEYNLERNQNGAYSFQPSK